MNVGFKDLPDVLKHKLAGINLIVFDAECVLCSRFFRFVLRFDVHERFRFATAQSPVGQDLYRALNLSTDDFQTNLVLVDGRIYGHLDSFAATMRVLGWPWRVLSVVRFAPEALKTRAYRLIARNRYRIFGRYDTCLIPDPEVRRRFVPEGWT